MTFWTVFETIDSNSHLALLGMTWFQKPVCPALGDKPSKAYIIKSA